MRTILQISMMLSLLLSAAQYSIAQEYEYEVKEDEEKVYEYSDIPEKLKYFKEEYLVEYDLPFDVVFHAVKHTLTEKLVCMIAKETFKTTDEGLYKGIIRTDLCLFVRGKETFDTLVHYSKDMPLIRGSNWATGTMQYKLVISEKSNGHTEISLKTEMSGMEDRVTNKVHFWVSNGILEKRFLDMVDNRLKTSN